MAEITYVIEAKKKDKPGTQREKGASACRLGLDGGVGLVRICKVEGCGLDFGRV